MRFVQVRFRIAVGKGESVVAGESCHELLQVGGLSLGGSGCLDCGFLFKFLFGFVLFSLECAVSVDFVVDLDVFSFPGGQGMIDVGHIFRT